MLDNAGLAGGTHSPNRLPALDIARGAAVLAMVSYHTAWDLSTLALVDLDIYTSRGWALYARSIAATFLVLAGIGLALAHSRGIRWRPFLRRLAVIAAGALLISVATFFAFPRSWIFFGILHNMAVSSLLALPFLFVPRPVAALAAIVVLALPFLVSGGVFDIPILSFVGLSSTLPDTNDWVPIFPWTGYVLAGIGVAPLLTSVLPRGDGGSIGRGFATLGRYSLVIYLLHQPLIFGALFGLRQVTGPNPVADAAPFIRECTRLFEAQGHESAVGRATCGCTVQELRRDGIWPSIRDGNPSVEYAQRAGNRAAECLKRSSS